MRRLAWLVFGVWVAVSVVALALVTGETDKFVLIVTPALAGYAVVGALVAGRQPRNAIGWLLLAIAILFSLSNVVEALATRSAHPAGGRHVARRLAERRLDLPRRRLDPAAVPEWPPALEGVAARRLVRDRRVRARRADEGVRDA